MKVVSLFSGCGGLDLGLIRTGHKVIWANDVLTDAVKTYRKNIGHHIVEGDISTIKASDIPDADLIVGGFPCQGFSIANMNRKAADPRNKLYLEYLRVLRAKQPKFFIAENVRGILSLEKGKVFERILTEFAACGYKTRYAVLNAADFGVPQTRHRVFILGIRTDVDIEIDFPPKPTHSEKSVVGLKKWVSSGEALGELPEPGEDSEIPNHVCTKYKLKHNGFINHRPVDPKKPAPTVTARGDTKGGAMINHHPNNKRRMSVRETAMVQSFPMDFIFEGSMTTNYLQIGNAVPPLLAEAIGRCFSGKLRLVSKKKSTSAGKDSVRQMDLGL